MGLVLAVVAALGVFFIYTHVAFGWTGFAVSPSAQRSDRSRRKVQEWLTQAGLEDVQATEFTGVMVVLFLIGGAVAFALFGGVVPAIVAGAFAATFPLASYRSRREANRSSSREAWPRMIEEIRLQAGSLGRSIPQAVFEVGRRAPEEMRPSFMAAEREWLISTDFARTVKVLKDRLADATADATLETLLVANEVGGSDLDRRLAALVEDRVQDLQGRKDARAKQAGVRFARRFVLLVPLGMAVAGMSIGSGRSAYHTPLGQLGVVVGLVCIAACWLWAGHIMRLPEEDRVFF
jgi:tight adherence protein B